MLRVKLLSAGRLIALALFVTIAAALAVYLVMRHKRSEPEAKGHLIDGKIVAVFNNTRYAHEVEGKVRFVLTAGTDKTYENGGHELEQVQLESFGADGNRHDFVTSERANVSDTSDLNKLIGEFISNVVVRTSDGLTVKTDYMRYDSVKNTVETDKPVAFEGRNYTGTCTGALIEATEERAHLLADVDFTIKPGDEKKEPATGKSAAPAGQREETAAEREARRARKRARKLARKQAEAAALAKANPDAAAGNPTAPAATARAGDRGGAPQFQSKEPTRVRCGSALLEKKEHRITLDGSANITQKADEMRADKIVAHTDDTNHIERAEARGNAYLKQGDRAEVQSPDMDFFFGASHQLERAVATGGAQTRSLGQEPLREARADTLEALFNPTAAGSLAETIKATGNADVKMHAPQPANAQQNPTERQLTANNITLEFHPDGKNLRAADASENAVMTVTPVRAVKGADKKTIHAPQMNAVFYEQENRIKTYTATGGVRIDIEATVKDAHPPRVTTSKSLKADFLADSQDIDQALQEGDFKYNEGDRHGLAERAIYDGQKEILNLRGKRPQAWDAKSRTQADEIDYDRQKDESHARGDVRTTYYSRETTNDATPFKNTKSPVFITAERADARNDEGIAIYTGKARGWQDDNFVKGDRIELYQDDKRMVATGNVESALYQAQRETTPGKRETVPGFATAERMNYSDTERLVHYEGNVHARQGADRIDAAKVDVYLQKETNEVDRMLADGNVTLTQPARRGTGDHLVYTASDGRAVLSGKNARVDDAEQGSTMGTELTFYSRDDRIQVENRQGTGRVRSTHRLTKSKEN
ncbi:MAG TPA: LPS export ABC transporter periplasmic protein LptC [Blastocatellia bacterium]|nr:LPS export ABC transporter periplasmic protein LptC [Blastocatellia bacterium]